MHERTLLIIEDDADLRRAAQLVLAHPDVAIETASNGMEAIRKARRLRPDLVLLDVRLPIVDGFDVFRCLRADADLAGTRVVLMSAYAHPAAFARARELGAAACFHKPYHPEALRRAVLEALGLEDPEGEAEADGCRREPWGAGACPPAPGLRIAVVEGDEGVRAEAAAIALEATPPGTSIAEFPLGIPALQAFRADPPDVAVVALRLSDIHGLNVVKLMRASPALAEVPVIALARAPGRSEVAAALAAGVTALVIRPIDAAQLRAEVRHAWLARIGAPGLGTGLGPGPRAA